MSNGAFYQSGEQILASGLSKSMRIVMAVVIGGLGVLLALGAAHTPSPTGTWVVAGFCFAVALTCLLKGRAQNIAGRIVAGVVAAMCAWYLVSCVTSEPITSAHQSQPSVLNAVLMMIFAGIPAGYFAIRGRFRPSAYEDYVEPGAENLEDYTDDQLHDLMERERSQSSSSNGSSLSN